MELERVRDEFMIKSREGYNLALRGLLKSYGVDKLSRVKPMYYEELVSRVRKIGMVGESKCLNSSVLVTGPNTIWNYPNLFEPKPINGGKAKYSIQLIIDDEATINNIKKVIDEVSKGGVTPLKEGENNYTLNASTEAKPKLVDIFGNAIDDPNEIYPGVYGSAKLGFYSYDIPSKRTKGVACRLLSLTKFKDGEKLYKPSLDKWKGYTEL